MKRFYTSNIEGNRATLGQSERDHCVRVLRTVKGEELEIVDGKGGLWKGILDQIEKREATVLLITQVQSDTDHSLEIVIATAIPKNQSRWELFLEKATELGVRSIVPIVTSRSEKSRIRTDRSEQIILSAFKQSKRLFLPVLHPVTLFDEWINQCGQLSSQKYIADCATKDNPYLGVVYKQGRDTVVLIGPEGDFTSEEISLAVSNSFSRVSLGNNTLRTETAGITACTIIQCSEKIHS